MLIMSIHSYSFHTKEGATRFPQVASRVAQEAKADVTVICGATTSTEGKDRALDEAMGPVWHDDPWYDYFMI